MSTEDGSNKNNIDGNGTDKNSIDKEKTQEFLHKNGRYLIMAGMLVVILIGIVMLVNNKGTSSADPKARAEKVLKEDYQVDENEAVTKLMKNYYKYYAEGNVDKMKEIATPISKLEQSYIKMFSERVEKYKNIKCYTKEGLDKDSYIVSVTMDMKFPKIKTTIPSLETFYVRTDDKGNLYIDNLYSTFNYIATNEKDVDSSVSEFIDKYEEQDDFVKLANDIEKKSSKAIKSDKDLEKYVNKLNDKVIPKWLNNYKKAQEEEQKKKEEEQKKKDEEKKKQEEEQKKKEEEKKKKEDNKQEEQQQAEQPAAETVYATTKVNIRDAASTDGNVVEMLEFGTELKRTGTEGDWSAVEHNGVTGYVKSEYLSTEVPQQDTSAPSLSEGSTVTLNGTINIRESMSETSTKVAVGYAGDKVTVVMSYAEGWTKVNYKDTIGYIKTELLQ
ncbi:MAG: SH3 domain-containing protein [Lachnospiraceae bacterium]